MKYNSRNTHRFDSNPSEKKILDLWIKEYNNKKGNGTLDFLLAEDKNEPMGEVTKRDRVVAESVIQWLGSPVGQGFLEKVKTILDNEK